jgi:hypothetical protein
MSKLRDMEEKESKIEMESLFCMLDVYEKIFANT